MTDRLRAVEDACTEHFGQRPVRASISFVGVEPIEVLRYEPVAGEWAYVTLGMSRHAMTPATADVLSADGPRAELFLHLRSDDRFAEAWRRLAVLAAAPSVEGVVYRPGMTVDLGTPFAAQSRCVGVVVGESVLPAVPVQDTVTDILSVIPATADELAWCRVHGAAALRELWRDQYTELLDLGRSPARLG